MSKELAFPVLKPDRLPVNSAAVISEIMSALTTFRKDFHGSIESDNISFLHRWRRVRIKLKVSTPMSVIVKGILQLMPFLT